MATKDKGPDEAFVEQQDDSQAVEVKHPGYAIQEQAEVDAQLSDGKQLGSMSNADVTGEDKDLEEVRRVREENERRAAAHSRTELHREIVVGDRKGAIKDKNLEAHCFGGRAYLNTHGEAVLDREGLISLRSFCEQAFQAVS